jgi:hypothetical protein
VFPDAGLHVFRRFRWCRAAMSAPAGKSRIRVSRPRATRADIAGTPKGVNCTHGKS